MRLKGVIVFKDDKWVGGGRGEVNGGGGGLR